MRSRITLAAFLVSLCLNGCHSVSEKPAEPSESPKLSYPVARKGDTVDDYHGTKVADPYRWMENLDSKEVADWIAAQNVVTTAYLESLPLRAPFQKRITELWNYPKT